MVRTWAKVGCVMGCVLASTAPVVADNHRPAADAIWSAETCLRVGDAAFEFSLTEGLTEEDEVNLLRVYSTATYECLGLSMEICEGQESGEACLSDLVSWVRDHRGEVVAGLPATIETDSTFRSGRYRRGLERAQAAADQTHCDSLSEEQRARYCETVSEGMALEDAYGAWRIARREGRSNWRAMPLWIWS